VVAATKISFAIQAKTGITCRLYNKARSSLSIQIQAAFEGPYAGHLSLSSYGHCVLFAGSSGITYQLSFLHYLVTGHSAEIVATRCITLIWVTRGLERLSWIQPWLDEILRSPNSDILTVKLFCTGPKTVVLNPNISVGNGVANVSSGRPNVSINRSGN
jgi:Ferric reductase NAD binding domain